MASGPIRILETVGFGEDFELDQRAYELRRGGRALKLERIPTEHLLLLVAPPHSWTRSPSASTGA